MRSGGEARVSQTPGKLHSTTDTGAWSGKCGRGWTGSTAPFIPEAQNKRLYEGPRSGRADPRFKQLPRSGYWYSGLGGNSGSEGGSPLPSPLNPSYAREVPAQDAGSFSGRQDFYSTTSNMDDGNQGYVSGPENSQYGSYEASAPGNNYGGEAAGSESYAASAYDAAAPADPDGEPVGIDDFLPVDEDSAVEAEALANEAFDAAFEAAENPAPFFSDVSDHEPVYSFSSRSKFLRGKAVYSRSRYTPGEPAAPPRMTLHKFIKKSGPWSATSRTTIHHPDLTPLQSPTAAVLVQCQRDTGSATSTTISPHDTESATLDPTPGARSTNRNPWCGHRGPGSAGDKAKGFWGRGMEKRKEKLEREAPCVINSLSVIRVFCLVINDTMIQAKLESTLRLKKLLTGQQSLWQKSACNSVLNLLSSRMKVLWISFLLIGHVICGPARMGPRSGRADPRFKQLPRSGYWYSGLGGNSGSEGGSPLPSPLNPSYAREVPAQDAGSFSGRQDFYSTTSNMDDGNQGYVSGPENSQYGSYEASAPGNNYGGEAAGSESYAASAYDAAAPAEPDGEPVGIDDFLPVDEDSAAEALANEAFDAAFEAAENPAPFFSDVSDHEPVYSFSSRSKFLRGKAVYSRSRYTPGEPAAPPRMTLHKFIKKSG
ncbi:unnamed protein product [Pleuronectes platessa]|uniref:Uncharacterized protein n=1 Tax=Pleuronectes platessa TaxID=8262 RepID=A0A9N7VVT9_PLEPL|nr:unnamed protein product [Pleuronectes platessa]